MDKDHLKALEDMQESIEFQVRRKQQLHEAAVPSGLGASTEESGTQMTDLQMTKLCADAMAVEVAIERAAATGALSLALRHGYYDPLHDDAQAMALVKKFHIALGWNRPGWGAFRQDTEKWVANFDDLNRAIVVSVATMQFDRTARETSTVAQDK